MRHHRMGTILARVAALAAVTGAVVLAGPSVAAQAACAPTMDVTGYGAYQEYATLNTSTGAIVYHWSSSGYAGNSGCVGTMTVYGRLTDRSIAPAQPVVTTGWTTIITHVNSDGSWTAYWGGDVSMDVTYRDSFSGAMRGTLGQITMETKAVFVPSGGGPSTTVCNAYTKTFTAGPTAPQYLSESADACLP